MEEQASILSEHRFWLQNLAEHARFLFYAIAPNEQGELRRLQTFILDFDNLLGVSNRGLSAGELDALQQNACKETQLFKACKLELLAVALSGRLNMHIPILRINHMLNEDEEYLAMMDSFRQGKVPMYYPIHYHLLWLSNAAVQAGEIASGLDRAENELLERAQTYETLLKNLFLKAIELNGLTRTKLNTFPALEALHVQAEKTVSALEGFLENLNRLRSDGSVLGCLNPLIISHMMRECAYYRLKLSLSVENLKNM